VKDRFPRGRTGRFPLFNYERRTRHYAGGRRLMVLLGTIAFSAGAVFAQSLENTVEKALDNNPLTKLAESKIKIAELKVKEAKVGKHPLVQFSQSVIRSNNPQLVFGSLIEQGRFSPSSFGIESLNNPKASTNFRSQISFQMPLFDQGETRSRFDQAEIGRLQANLQAESVRQQLRFDVVRAFYGVVLGKELLNMRKDAVRSAKANRKKARDMAEVGLTNEADVLAAEVEVADAEQRKFEAENQLITTAAALNLMLGDKPEFERVLIGNLEEKYFPICDQEELIRTALQNRPDYLSSELAITKSRRQTKTVKDQKLPRVDAFGNFGYSSPYIKNGSTDYTVGVSLNYTLFDAGRKMRTEQAVEAETQAEGEKHVLANEISLGVVRSFQNFKTARSKIKVSIKSISQADEALRIVQDRYHFNLTTITEVIRAEAALQRSKHDLLTARYEYYVSYASVLLATGRLTDVRMFD